MNRTELIAGLDAGSTKVCIVIVEVDPGGRIQIVGEGLQASEGIQRGIVTDIDAAARSIAAAAEQAQRVAGVELSSVFVGVTGEHIVSLNSRGRVSVPGHQRQVRRDDVDRALDASRVIVLPPDREIIQAIPRGFSIDGQDGIRSPVGMSGSRLEVEAHIVHGMSSFLQNLAKSVDKAGLGIEGLVLGSYAASRAVLNEAEKTLGVALVDIGGGTTNVAIFSGGSIVHSGMVPVGGKNVTQDLAVGLQCSLAEAERVKRELGAASTAGLNGRSTFKFTRNGSAEPTELPAEILIQIIEPRMSEIFQLVEGVLKRGGGRPAYPSGVVMTGGGSSLRGTPGLAESVLDTPIRPGKLNEMGGMADSVSAPEYSTAVGLAVHGAQVLPDPVVPPAGRLGGMFSKLRDALMGSES